MNFQRCPQILAETIRQIAIRDGLNSMAGQKFKRSREKRSRKNPNEEKNTIIGKMLVPLGGTLAV